MDTYGRPCLVGDGVCEDCTGERVVCLVRLSEDAGLYDDEPRKPIRREAS